MENEHRDDGLLGWRTSRRQQSGAQLQEFLGRELDERITAASIILIRQRGAIISRWRFIPRQNPFYCALPYNDVTHGQFKPEAPLVIPVVQTSLYGAGTVGVPGIAGSPFAKAIALVMRNGKIAAHFAPTIFSTSLEMNDPSRI